MQVKAKLKNLRIAPRKAKIVADFIKGLDVNEALERLETSVRKSNPVIKKLLQSAIGNAENNFGLDKTNLFVLDARIGAGPTLKRWMPRAFGRASQILKRTSQIELVLAERIEGKGRKTKEEMEKEKAKRLADKEKQIKEAQKEEEKSAKEIKVEKEVTVAEKTKTKKAENKGGIASRIFRRKSM